MDLLVELAATGRIGAVRAGMPLAEAQALLGAGQPHPMLRMRPDADGYPYLWGSLALEKSGDEVTVVELRLRPGTRLELPAALGSRHDGASATVERDSFLTALAEAGCSYEVNPQSDSSEQSSITTKAGTTAFFVHFAVSESVPVAGHYLVSIHNRG